VTQPLDNHPIADVGPGRPDRWVRSVEWERRASVDQLDRRTALPAHDRQGRVAADRELVQHGPRGRETARRRRRELRRTQVPRTVPRPHINTVRIFSPPGGPTSAIAVTSTPPSPSRSAASTCVTWASCAFSSRRVRPARASQRMRPPALGGAHQQDVHGQVIGAGAAAFRHPSCNGRSPRTAPLSCARGRCNPARALRG
jgi:hypothetical protein